MAINLSNPVSSNPLNRGLVGWWLNLPQNRGGIRFMDLMNKNHVTLTNGPTWVGGGRPGGFGALNFDGTNDYTEGGVATAILGAQERTFSVWVYQKTLKTDNFIFTTSTAGLNRQACSLSFNTIASGDVYMAWQGCNFYTSGSLIVAKTWRHIAIVYTGGTLSTTTSITYLDAISQSVTKDGGSTGSANTASQNFKIGGSASVGLYSDCIIDDFRMYNRALSASEVSALYNDSRTGYGLTLNRLPRRVAYSLPAGGSFQSSWARGSNTIIYPVTHA